MAGMRRLLEPATEFALADAAIKEPDLRWPDQNMMAKVVTAWEEAGDRDRALALANEAAEPAVRDGRREALVGFLVRQGDFDGALAVAGTFEDSIVTARLLTDITRARLAKSETPELNPVLTRIGAIADGLTDEAERIEARALIGQIQALAGRTEDAIATADALGHEHRRDWIIQNAVLERMRRGDLPGALALSERIADPAKAVSTLGYAVQALDNPSDRETAMILLDRAAAIAETISEPETRDFRSLWIRNSRVKFLDTDEALAIIETIDDADMRDLMHGTRAGQLAEAGDLDKAMEVARLAGPGSLRVFTIRSVAKAAAKAGKDDFAREAFRMANDEVIASLEFTGPEQHLGFTADSQAQEGFIDDAWATVELMEGDEIHRPSAIAAIATALANSGNTSGAMDALESIPEDHFMYEMNVIRIASAIARAGDLEGAIAILREHGGRGVGYILVQMANPEDIVTDREWRARDIEYSDPPPPPPAKPAGWDECLADPTDECMLTVVQKVAETEGYTINRDFLLVRVAVGWARLEQMNKAREAMAAAEEVVREYLEMAKENPRQDEAFDTDQTDRLVSIWAEIGDLDRAAALANEFDGPYTGRIMAAAYNRAGDLNAAIALSETTKDPSSQSDILNYIGQVQIEAGDLAGARVTISRIRRLIEDELEDYDRTRGLHYLAKLQAKSGMFEEALKIAADLAETRERDLMLRDIAEIYAGKGDLNRARETLDNIEDNVIRASGFRTVGASTAKAGQHEAARALFDEALAIVEAMPPGEDRDRTFYHTAWWLAEAGDYERAITLPAKIEGTKRRAEAYQSLAEQMIGGGAPDAAGPLLEKAMKAAAVIPVLDTRDRIFGKIAERWAEAGDFATALKTAEMIEGKDNRSGTLGDIAVDMARLGDRAGAMDIVRDMKFRNATNILVRIASPDPDGR